MRYSYVMNDQSNDLLAHVVMTGHPVLRFLQHCSSIYVRIPFRHIRMRVQQVRELIRNRVRLNHEDVVSVLLIRVTSFPGKIRSAN